MTDNIVQLGFEIDTATLNQAKTAAAQLAEALTKVADAADKQAAATKREQAATQSAAQTAQQAAGAVNQKEQAAKRLADTLAHVGQQSQAFGQNMQGLSSQLSGLAVALGGGGGFGGITGALQGAAGGMGRFISTLGPMGGAIGGVTLGVTALGGSYLALVGATYKAQESFALIDARLKNVYGSGIIAASVFEKINKLASENGVSIQAAADSYLRLARNNEAIGLTTAEMTNLTDAVQKLGRVSGASQGELASGMMQFSQALAAGRLNGDELRSIMENMPALAKAIADGMGVSVGQIRAMGAEGQLTSDKITGAILKQLPKIREEFQNLPQTSDMAFARVGNSFERLLATVGQKIKSSEFVTGLANAIASAVDGATKIVQGPSIGQQQARMITQAENARNAPITRLFSGFNDNYARALETRAASLNYDAGDQNRMRAYAEQAQAMQRVRAPFVRSQGVVQEFDDQATKVKKLREEMQTLQTAYQAFLDQPKAFPEEDAKRLEKYPEYIAAYKTQLENLIPVLQDYYKTTGENRDDVLRFGAGGAASIGAEARSMVNSAAGKAQNISFDQAQSAIIDRRTTELGKQTEAINIEIAAEQRRKDAVNAGAIAEREAEVATKAYALQMQLFGTKLTPEATKAIEEYKNKLRELLTVQKDVTDAQRLANAQSEIAITRAIMQARETGANVGQLKLLRIELEYADKLRKEGGGNAGVTGGSASTGGGNSTASSSGTVNRNQLQADINTLEPQIRSVVDMILKAFPNAILTSAERLGDRGQHGNAAAADLSIKNLSEADKRAVVAMALNSGNVGGIGTYNSTGDLLHIDSRSKANGLQYWGPDKTGASLGQTPQWFQDYVTMARGGQTIPGSTGVAAAGAEREAAILREKDATQAVLAETRRAIEEQRRIMSANDVGGQAAERRRVEAENFGRQQGGTSEEQRIAAAEKLVQLETEAAAAREKASKEYDDQNKLLKDQERVFKSVGREREIELEVLQRVNELKKDGLNVDEKTVDAIRAQVTARVNQSVNNERTKQQADEYAKIWTRTGEAIGSAIETAFRDAVMNGKVDAERILKGLIADIGQQIIRATITKPIGDWFANSAGSFVKSFFGGAHGAVLNSGNMTMYAAGGVLSGPTGFGRNNGWGLAGEAGAEAILPLARGPDGRLGVQAGMNSNVHVVVNDMRSSAGAEPVETKEEKGPDGQRMISIVVRDEVRRQMKNGDYDRELRSNFNTQRVLTRR